ncbi:NAD(P)/FAD-dependent oxidoreductase [Halobacillus litoralis]|uniref:dihydrolipoyl dehydrogenase family protein n=1 Tax=Halobacillus litoralis TaxID=45668 RepID=UPI001CD3C60A|nr:NAD(P)/FAD-dependent oxidoreductase [Halobacillus litoralis]MCA0969738.1 NAD(P)/FAD-dependent oxidoreductase [Halobacillus litoralis]
MSFDYQLVVIGGGSGGLTVAAGAASFGTKVALIERKSELGGDCLHYGCMPSKALIQAAKEVHQANEVNRLDAAAYDQLFRSSMERVQEAVQEVQEHDSKDRFINLGIDIIEAEASFLDEHTLRVGDQQITAKRVVLATGSSPFLPPIDGLDTIDYVTNETIFSLKERPKSLAVIGGGIIGLELSQAMSRLGVDVTVLEAGDRILAKEDEEIAEEAGHLLSEDLRILTRASVNRVERDHQGAVLHYSKDGEDGQVHAEQVLVAVGRKPNTDKLDLDQAGVGTDKGFISVDATMRTSKRHIYAVGDCNGSMPFTHVAGMEGKVAVSNAVFGLSRKVSYEKVPWVIYTAPEIYHLGMTEQEAKAVYGDSLMTFKTKLENNDRFMAEQRKEGFVKVLTNSRGKIVGAHAIGEGAGEWMQEVGTVQALNKKFQAISNIIHPYPARNNVVSQTADLFWREKLFDSNINKALRWYVKNLR